MGEKLGTIILAAGKGTRMKSDLAKVLHPLCGKPLLSYSIGQARQVHSDRTVIVIGHQADRIREIFRDEDIIFVEQKRQLGTGHAVLQTKGVFRDYQGTVLVLCGDVPLLKAGTIMAMWKRHMAGAAAVTVLTVVLDDPGGYGRVLTDSSGKVLRIVEEKDASDEERRINEINTGIYCFESTFLFENLDRIGNKNAQGEYYLTDMIEIARRKGLTAQNYRANDPTEVMGINSVADLERAARFVQSHENRKPRP